MRKFSQVFLLAILQFIAAFVARPTCAQDKQAWHATRDRLATAMRSSGDSDGETDEAIDRLKAATTKREFEAALEPLTLLQVSINPESRVKLNSLRPKISLFKDRPQRFLIAVDNTAGITAPLNLSAIDLATDPPGTADWCTIEVINTPFASRFFSGEESEYKIMQITPHVSGLREIRIVGDAGQGTQDLGFRATTDVLMDIKAKW